MHYYERNIGDYYRKAGRLNILQHGVYTLLIDACYDREQFPTLDEAIDWVWAETDEEVEAVKFVLRKFFKLNESGVYVQNHIEEDLIAYKNFLTKQSENGKKGGRPPKNKPKDNLGNGGIDLDGIGINESNQINPTETQINPNKPNESLNHLTNNQEPISSSGSNACEENFKPQQNVIAGYAIYHTQDTNLYSLIELEKKYPNLQQDFIEQAKASYQTITLSTSQYVDLMGRLRQWSLTKSIGQTPQKWINSWLNIVKNNAHEVVKPVKTSSVEKTRHRYGTGVISTNNNQIRDVGEC